MMQNLIKLLEKQYGYDPLLETSPFLTPIQLIDVIGGIQHFIEVVGKWIFDKNIMFTLPITCDNLYYCCINNN